MPRYEATADLLRLLLCLHRSAKLDEALFRFFDEDHVKAYIDTYCDWRSTYE